uniref:4F2 cell-surface antigen heavy chain n=1 Tax=Phallusia mammillata TaxID=59560 RepID=A0A6F9DT15_9ASCI|nr:4F2 cell-surface antigen heavy chain [Phallusia mammillata]
MGSPEKPLDVEMGDMSDETHKLNPDVKVENGLKEEEKSEETRFTGLKKEELLEISNQPKWVRARWVLFILFWLAWIGMLVAAILIVVNAPRCKPEPKPEWYQDTVVYEVDAKKYAGGFAGMNDRLEYIKELSAKTVLLTAATDPVDQKAIVDNSDKLAPLVENIHGKGMKVMVDLVVSTMSTANNYFTSSLSSCTASNPGNLCDFFIWSTTNTSTLDTTESWVYNPTRNQYYKATSADSSQAFINYDSTQAKKYLNDLVAKWFERQFDGVQLRDFKDVKSTTPARSLLDNVWTNSFANQNTSKALFAYSSLAGASLLSTNSSAPNTSPNPVLVNSEVSMLLGNAGAGKRIQSAIETWRQASSNIGSYTASPLGQQLAAARQSQYAAGLNILTVALPGVPVIRSGDEAGLTDEVFNWTSKGTPNQATNLLSFMKEMTVRKVEGIQSMHSMRFDTRNNDTTFRFLPTGSDDVLAFFRQWDTKPAILVVSNMSPNNATVNVMSDQGLKDKDGKAIESGKIVVSSYETEKVKPGKLLELKELMMTSGSTIVFAEN